MEELINRKLSNKNLIFSKAEGSNFILLLELYRKAKSSVIFVARDDARLEEFRANIKLFEPDLNVYEFPAWDSLPYDRASPKPEIMEERVEALCRICSDKSKKLVLTTVNAITQRTLPKEYVQKLAISMKVGDLKDFDQIAMVLVTNGYTRSTTANEPGEFAIRGSLIDLVISQTQAYRLDFFGKKIESIRKFDPLTQISERSVNEISVIPTSEIVLTKESSQKFKDKFSELFGSYASEHPLYLAVENGHKFIGMENWLPLFFDKLSNLFEYFESPTIIYENLVQESTLERFAQISEYYLARKDQDRARKIGKDFAYLPLETNLLYLSPEEIDSILKNNQHYILTNLKHDFSNYNNIELSIEPAPDFHSLSQNNKTPLNELLRDFIQSTKFGDKRPKILLACNSEGSRERLKTMFEHADINYQMINSVSDFNKMKSKVLGLSVLQMNNGFISNILAIITEQDLFGEKFLRLVKKAKRADNFIRESSNLVAGELVVHQDYGIGRFEQLETVFVNKIGHDCLKLIYDGGDILYVPVENIEAISHYGGDNFAVLDKLGSTNWQSRKAKLKDRIKVAAETLLKIAAERETRSGKILSYDASLYDEFVARFPYSETDDQLSAIEDIKDDLLSGKPMDRLICGDVGFGKTEVALRAAFMAVAANTNDTVNQVAIIAPTTLLARQHYKTFHERFKGFPFNVKPLSRLVTTTEAKKIKQGLKDSSVDIIVGTHALLSKSVEFKNLSLVIVDEEQHFGVLQKERLKELQNNVHMLTLSATPIPRTLQMSLTGIKSLSIIATPPIDRLAVRTFVQPFDPIIIRETILREHYRGGRSFVVCPKISDLDEVSTLIHKLVPEVSLVRAHGQMTPTELDEIMNNFYEGKFDILVSTTIVESGLDVPGANTMIIYRADQFGLSQLYQLRGRVGRAKVRGYAYLTVPANKTLSKDAEKRLSVMQKLDSLGAGFSVATHDMDIRGFGNLVGDAQSGHIREVGVELYQSMLKEAIEGLNNVDVKEVSNAELIPQINLGVSVLIPESYISDVDLRLGLYRRIADLENALAVEDFAIELIDRFGKLPAEVNNLLEIVKLKILCKKAHVQKLDFGPKGMIISFYNNQFPNPEALLKHIHSKQLTLKLRADMKLVVMTEISELTKKFKLAEKVIGELLELINP